ncbi:hypothetical protein ASL14_22075 [Paenibacillus sp. IHB B 3084]|uniref:hypothetical protein n=1 Tax=Paenibacillus TaxID=44249 RepID=UPI000720486C|nr:MULTISPECIES: hypothetical protein [Paenibacillus]ALP38465.1 hypothetical protein ASL14_22075 [Paenibacillus sp. IHB B 3084]MBE0337355.1 hypothetical protein [Paenibacillus sp. 23TSA30-6]
MRQWKGRQVILYYGNNGHTQKVRGTIEKWDDTHKCVILGPKMLSIPFENITYITMLPPGRERRSRHPAKLNSIGYVMSVPVQFDNAILFQSAVTVWKEDQLIAYNTKLTSHTDYDVVLDDGQTLSKEGHLFVVRSLRGEL